MSVIGIKVDIDDDRVEDNKDTDSKSKNKSRYEKIIDSLNEKSDLKILIAVGVAVVLILLLVLILIIFSDVATKTATVNPARTVPNSYNTVAYGDVEPAANNANREIEFNKEQTSVAASQDCMKSVIKRSVNGAVSSNVRRKCNLSPVENFNRIRFVMSGSLLMFALNEGRTNEFDKLLSNETEKQINEFGFSDLYYNYLAVSDGYLYEGRSLHCRFDEDFLPDDHRKTVTVGIPNKDMFMFDWNEKKFASALTTFLNCFGSNGLLSDDYRMEFYVDGKELFNQDFIKAYGSKIRFRDDDSLIFEKYFKPIQH